MFVKPPDPKDLARMALTMDDLVDTIVDLWPDNLAAHNLMAAMGNQWRLAPSGGPYALDYATLTALWPLLGVPEADRLDVFKDLQVMESAALAQMQENEKK